MNTGKQPIDIYMRDHDIFKILVVLERFLLISFYIWTFSLVEEKERKIKEAEEYRQYLIGQMESKKGQEHLDALNDKIFVQHRLLADNETNRDIERKVQEVDVRDKQKPVWFQKCSKF